MTDAWLDGVNIGWTVTLAALCFIAGTAVSLAMLVIPETYHLRIERDKPFISGALFAVAGLVVLIAMRSQAFSIDELESGGHWKNDCSVIEVSMPAGTFSESVNLLNCAGVIIKVPTPQYDEYIRQWELYKAKNK